MKPPCDTCRHAERWQDENGNETWVCRHPAGPQKDGEYRPFPCWYYEPKRCDGCDG